jgi:hypothetical protein
MPLPTPPLKPGVTTTEFWTVILCGLLLTAQAALSLTTVAWAAGGVTLLGLIYTIQRGNLKSIVAKAAAEKLKLEGKDHE